MAWPSTACLKWPNSTDQLSSRSSSRALQKPLVFCLPAAREVLKPQPLLSYRKSDGSPNLKTCIAGRYKEFKWFGNSDRVFR